MMRQLPEINRILGQMQGKTRDAFLQMVRDAVAKVSLVRVETLLREGRTEELIRLLQIGPEMAAPLIDAIDAVYRRGGSLALQALPSTTAGGTSLKVYFQGRHPRAERFLLERSAGLVVEINESIGQSIRLMAQEGLAKGWNPRKTALDIVGRIDPFTKRRTGGIISLTEGQARYVTNMRSDIADLITPEGYARYMSRARRDKRFDAMVTRAYKNNKTLSTSQVQRITGRYSDRLLQLRGETIARTETIAALNAGREEGLRQLAESGAVPEQFIKKVWHATGDARTRDSHLEMDGDEVAMNEPFVSPTGGRMLYPGDSSLGAGGEDVINCRCWMETKVDWIGARKAEKEAA